MPEASALDVRSVAASDGGGTERWEGETGDQLAARLAVPAVRVYGAVDSTMDVAHALAARGAAGGTLVIANQQATGRGRGGRVWVSRPNQGIWLTLLERPSAGDSVALLAIRCGLSVAGALDAFAPTPVRLKWPNDLYVGAGKVGGILIEARWQDQRPLWVAVGIGVNVEDPDVPGGAGLRTDAARRDVLAAVVSALREAVARLGTLTPAERHEWSERDLARGRQCREPVPGRVLGIGPSAELLVETTSGVQSVTSGSLIFDDGEGVA